MWRKIVSPERLFLIGTLQALSPYVIWYFQGLNPSYRYEVTYLPVAIWGIGYICFWLGTKIIRIKLYIQPKYPVNISFNDIKSVTTITIVIVFLQVIQAVRLYGVLPIYGYITGTSNVFEVNNVQTESGFGQLGALTATLFFLNGLLLTFIIKSLNTNRRSRIFFIFASLVEIFGGLIAGKRQGLLIFIMFLCCGLSINLNNPLIPVLKFFNLPSSKIVRTLIYLFIGLGLFSIIGFLASVRTSTSYHTSGIEEIINYLQYPLINLEAQCKEIGLGPYKFNFFYPLFSLLPNKVYEEIAPAPNESPFRPEPTIGAGFYGNLHWGMGIIGVMIYSFIFGFTSKYFYNKSFTNLFHLLVYCQISWTLLSAHTYNHFLNLIFLPIPTILFFVLCIFLNHPKRKVSESL